MNPASYTIKQINVDLFHIPLKEALHDAKHGAHTYFELIVVTITLQNGIQGTGYTYTGGKGGFAIKAMIAYDFAPALMGKDASKIDEIYDMMEWHIHYVGRGGIAAFCISAIDIALWDIKGKLEGQSLWQMVGGASTVCNAYRGGIDLNFSLDKLLASVQSYLDEGYKAVKIKVGKNNFADDLERVKEVRQLIGNEIIFMVDANYSWDIQHAINAMQALEEYQLFWLEEPIIPDDYKGMAKVAMSGNIPIAVGENYHTIHEFSYCFEQAKIGFIQPDASNCGGITGWLKVFEMAQNYHIPVCSHGMQELHVNLLAGTGGNGWLEVHSFPIDQYTTQPLTLKKDKALAHNVIGTGVAFDENKLKSYKV